MSDINSEEIVKTLKEYYYQHPDGVGIWAVDLFGIRDLIRIQFSREHFEILEPVEVMPKVIAHFKEELTKRHAKIADIQFLSQKYVQRYNGPLGGLIQESFVKLSDVIDILNHRRKEHNFLQNGLNLLDNE